MSAGYDAEVADLFRDLRAASNLTEADLAARIATPVEVVQALEQGALYALPPWPETCRVVSAYGTILNLDTRPLLRRIYAQLEAGVVELGPKPVQDVPGQLLLILQKMLNSEIWNTHIKNALQSEVIFLFQRSILRKLKRQ